MTERLLFTIPETATRIGRSTRTVRRRIADGDLEAVYEGGQPMVRADALDRYIEGLARYGSRAGAREPRARHRSSRRRPDYRFLEE